MKGMSKEYQASMDVIHEAKKDGNLSLVAAIFALVRCQIANMGRSGGGSGIPELVVKEHLNGLLMSREAMGGMQRAEVGRHLAQLPELCKQTGVPLMPVAWKETFDGFNVKWTGEEEPTTRKRRPFNRDATVKKKVFSSHRGKRVPMSEIINFVAQPKPE